MRSKSHPVNQNANIAVNESHRNRRKRRILKSPGHPNKCRIGGLQFFFFNFSWNKHTRDDFAAMLNLLYVTWTGINQSDIFRQWILKVVYFDSWSWQSFESTCDVFNCLFPLDVKNWNTAAIKSVLLFMAGLFIGFLVEKCVACQSR